MTSRSGLSGLFSESDRSAMLRASDPRLLSGDWGAVERIADRRGERFLVYAPGSGLKVLYEVRPASGGGCEIADGRSGAVLATGRALLDALRAVLGDDGGDRLSRGRRIA